MSAPTTHVTVSMSAPSKILSVPGQSDTGDTTITTSSSPGLFGVLGASTVVTPITSTTSLVGTSRTIGSKQMSRSYSYDVTPVDLAKEQQAFQPGEGVSNK